MKYYLLIPIFLILSQPAFAEQKEELHYHLSYSGLITGFIWKNLADVTLRLSPESTTFRESAAKRLSMDVSTANYSVAETLHPIRYRWESTLSEDLQRTLQVTIVDKGESDSHEIFWYDWDNHLISGFRKREQVDVSIPMFDEDPVLEWEKDTLSPPPEFISPQPDVAAGLSYLLTSQRLQDRLRTDAIDPVAMFHKLRWHDFEKQPSTTLQILFEEELAPYVATTAGTQELSLGECTVAATRVEIHKGDESGEDGMMTLWLSDDIHRLPLRIDVDASLGELHVLLQALPQTFAAKNCDRDSF